MELAPENRISETTLDITAAGAFAYQYRAHAAWLAVLGGDFLVQTFAS